MDGPRHATSEPGRRRSGLELLARGFAEGFQRGVLHEVSPPDAEGLKFRAVDPAFDPLVDRLPGDRRVYQLPRLLHTVVVARLSVGRVPLAAPAADTKARQSIAEVHECQLYHTVHNGAIAIWMILRMDSYRCPAKLAAPGWLAAVRRSVRPLGPRHRRLVVLLRWHRVSRCVV